jgi:ubiquinone/menaquinone biosynthesis C-methylase UbiE
MTLPHARSDWYTDFFSGLVVDFWKIALPPEVTAAEADFLIRHLRLAPESAARILDVPCGHGRLAIELAERLPRATGTGFDISDELLEAEREDAAARGVSQRVSWRRGDMRALPFTAEFDAAFCCGGSFGFFDDAGEAAFLAAVARALVPGGRFVLDASKAAECLFPAFRERHSFEKNGVRFEAENSYEPRPGRIENLYTLTRGETVETKLASHRLYTASQVCGLLEEAGFDVRELYGSTADAPFVLGSPQLFVVARRS